MSNWTGRFLFKKNAKKLVDAHKKGLVKLVELKGKVK